MSYDLTVYATRGVDDGEMEAVVDAGDQLSIDDVNDAEFRVLRGDDEDYSFTVFGPDPVDPDDLPDPVAALALRPTSSWQVVVEGSNPDEIPHARRFAAELARAAGGVALDEQTDDIVAE